MRRKMSEPQPKNENMTKTTKTQKYQNQLILAKPCPSPDFSFSSHQVYWGKIASKHTRCFLPKCIRRTLPFSGTAFEICQRVYWPSEESLLLLYSYSLTIRANTVKKLFDIFNTKYTHYIFSTLNLHWWLIRFLCNYHTIDNRPTVSANADWNLNIHCWL